MNFTNEHKLLILGEEYRFELHDGVLFAEQRRFGGDGPWHAAADPLVLQYLRVLAEDGDRQVLRLRAPETLQRELKQNLERIAALQRRNGWLAAEIRGREPETDDELRTRLLAAATATYRPLGPELEQINIELQRLTGVRWAAPRYQGLQYLTNVGRPADPDVTSDAELVVRLRAEVRQPLE